MERHVESDAVPLPEDEQHECAVCGAEAAFVYLDGDKVCAECSYSPAAKNVLAVDRRDAWERWWDHRRDTDEYQGWTGDDRIKFVGGFELPYHRD